MDFSRRTNFSDVTQRRINEMMWIRPYESQIGTKMPHLGAFRANNKEAIGLRAQLFM